MNFLKNKIKNLSDPIKKIAENTKQILQENTKQIFQKTTNDKSKDLDLVFIYPRLFWMTFPTKEKCKLLAEFLNNNFNTYYFIWNVGELTYDANIFNNQVAEYNFVGYPCPPLNIVFLICKNILEWLIADKKNVAIIHCQSNKARSGLIISCLLSMLKKYNHPLEALTYFCNKLKIDEIQLLFPSQTLYLRHFANLCDNIKINKQTLLLEKVILSEVPLVKEEDQDIDTAKAKAEGFRPYLQIFQNSKIIYNYLSQNKPAAYFSTDLTIYFNINIEISEDILIRCRHFKTNEERVSVFRILLNPAFAFDEVVRLYEKDIDLSSNIKVSPNFFVDIIFKKMEKTSDQIDYLVKVKDECIALAKLVEETTTISESNTNVGSDNETTNKFSISDEPSIKNDIEEQKVKLDNSDNVKDNNNAPDDLLIDKPMSDNDDKKDIEKIQKNEQLERLLKLDEEVEDEDEDVDDYISKLEQN